MKRSLFSCAAVVVAMFATDASALYTRCEIKYETRTINAILEIGGGEGKVRCWDRAGFEYRTKFDAAMGGLGGNLGYCRTRGTIHAQGPGFALNDLLTGLAQVQVAPTFGRGQGASVGVRLNVLGLNAQVFGSDQRVSGPCIRTAGVQGLIATNIARMVRIGPAPARRPPPAIAGPARQAPPPVAGPARGSYTGTGGSVIVDQDDDGVIVDNVMR